MKGLEPASGEIVIPKKDPSGFFGTDLKTRLTVLGVDTVVICGVSTSGCVRAAALDAMQHGSRLMVSRTSESISAQKLVVGYRYSDRL
jgi:nicotinamidase-related amidase